MSIRSIASPKRLLWIALFPMLTLHVQPLFAGKPSPGADHFFVLDDGTDLRKLADPYASQLLTPVRGEGNRFGTEEIQKYCKLKNSSQVQWTVTDLQTGEIISRSPNAREAFFGASSSKIFVAAALLDKQCGKLDKRQLDLMIKMIVKSDNGAWRELQREAGEDGSDDSGRQCVNEFVQDIGCTNTRGFQGWMCMDDGTKIHGNELNTMALSKFLYSTYHRKYPGAEILWKIMHATKTGRQKINKYTPREIYIGGKTGTYDGPNESPETIHFKNIRARNHVAILKIGDKYYGVSILTNTGSSWDVAVLGGGLMREFLGVGEAPICASALRK